MRTALLIVALIFIFGFAAATAAEVASNGFDVLTLLSIFVLLLLGVGIGGALRETFRD